MKRIVLIEDETSVVSFIKKGLQEKGVFKAPQVKMDNKDFGIGAQILHDIDITNIRLLSNSEQTKRVGMIGYGLEIMEYVEF